MQSNWCLVFFFAISIIYANASVAKYTPFFFSGNTLIPNGVYDDSFYYASNSAGSYQLTGSKGVGIVLSGLTTIKRFGFFWASTEFGSSTKATPPVRYSLFEYNIATGKTVGAALKQTQIPDSTWVSGTPDYRHMLGGYNLVTVQWDVSLLPSKNYIVVVGPIAGARKILSTNAQASDQGAHTFPGKAIDIADQTNTNVAWSTLSNVYVPFRIENDSAPDCTPVCRNGGTCTGDNTGSNTCRCNPRWKGDDCNTPVCPLLKPGHGTCTNPNAPTCTNDWEGHQCQTPKCTPSECDTTKGTCDSPHTCTCKNPSVWGGAACNEDQRACTPVQATYCRDQCKSAVCGGAVTNLCQNSCRVICNGNCQTFGVAP